MTTQTITISESGMTFGAYLEDHCFHIEESDTYKGIKDGVKIAEFLLYRNSSSQPMVWIIEAKHSSPRPETQPDFDQFIAEIKEKLSNTLFLYVATRLRRHSTYNECSSIFQNLDLEATNFRLILIINEHKEEWLPPLQDALTKAMKPIVKIWSLPPTSVAVLNEVLAQDEGLIL